MNTAKGKGHEAFSAPAAFNQFSTSKQKELTIEFSQ